MKQGQKAIAAQANAGGGAFSGALGKALMSHGQDMASQEYAAQHNRWQQDRKLAMVAETTRLDQRLRTANLEFGARAKAAGMGMDMQRHKSDLDIRGILGAGGQQLAGGQTTAGIRNDIANTQIDQGDALNTNVHNLFWYGQLLGGLGGAGPGNTPGGSGPGQFTLPPITLNPRTPSNRGPLR